MRVFLSSTALDLAEHRSVADDTLLRLQQQSVVMERFGPLPGTPVAECERMAAECDVLVCIVAHRYGFEPEAGQGSITRREVEAARRAGKPVYAWIVDAQLDWQQPKELDLLKQREVRADPARLQAVLAAMDALDDFKAWLGEHVTCEAFTTPDDLGRKIAVTLSQIAQQRALAPRGSAPGSVAPPPPELRVVHALQPAPHFQGRDKLVDDLSTWMDDTASPDRVWALVAAGGTGKTAIAELVIARLRQRWPVPGAGHVLVWSFYERPDADAFLRECGQLFLGETDDAPPGGRLERLQRGLRDGRPHLVVLDGLERVQAEAGPGRVRGELEDHQLRLLLQAIAAGLGRTRALLTSRFALTDLRDWQHRGLVETQLEDLQPDAARAVLRGWGVQGADAALDAVCAQVGGHALSVAVIGSYLGHFEQGRIAAAATLKLDEAAGDDPKAAKLARVLGFYAQQLPAEERELLARLSVFPRGITLEVLGVLVQAGGAVAGVLVNATPALPRLLGRLVERGLAFRYATSDDTLTWTAHPFVRQRFATLLGCPAEEVFNAVAERLGLGLEAQPENMPTKAAVLDRYEQLIEVTRLAGREQEAFDLYFYGLSRGGHLGWTLGDFARGHRILRAFLPQNGSLQDFGRGIDERDQPVVLNDLALWSHKLGRLTDAAELWHEQHKRSRLLGDPATVSIGLRNLSDVYVDLGRLQALPELAEEAMKMASLVLSNDQSKHSLGHRAYGAHRLGDVGSAQADFATATTLEDEPLLYSLRGLQHARHHLDLGIVDSCRAIVDAGLSLSQRNSWNDEIPHWHALLARLALVGSSDPAEHLTAIRDWTARTGEMALIIEAHDLAARAALARADLAAALAEAEDGLRQARLCGYRLLQIELEVTLSAIHLAWPDANAALAAARRALDLATTPDCGDAWGEADAAQAWGLAFVAMGQTEHARRAFTQALAARERIQHPQAAATREALARLG